MATTSDYLIQLQLDKENLKLNLEAKGVKILDTDTFTEMSQKVNEIETGGGDISEYFAETITGSSGATDGWYLTIKKLPAFTNTGTNCQNMFFQYKGMEIDLSKFITNNVTTMYNMFADCSNLISLDLSNFDTSNVTNMYGMFYGCENLTSLDLSNFDVSKVTDISSLFYKCKKLAKIDMRNFEFANISSKNAIFGNNEYYGVPNNCEIIVKDDANKTWVTTNYSRLTNVKTIAELEA